MLSTHPFAITVQLISRFHGHKTVRAFNLNTSSVGQECKESLTVKGQCISYKSQLLQFSSTDIDYFIY